MKEFLENNAYFVDFFNAYFFGGERVLKPENCMKLDSEMNDSNMDLEKHVDVIRKYNDGNVFIVFFESVQFRNKDECLNYEHGMKFREKNKNCFCYRKSEHRKLG